jgi:hypothetical protein
VGYEEGVKYAPSDLGSEFKGHLERGGAALNKGITPGWLEFRCSCGKTISVSPS